MITEALMFRVPDDDRITVDDAVSVAIRDDETDGDRETTVPTIAIWTHDDADHVVMLTWQQARAVAVAITEMEGVARCG